MAIPYLQPKNLLPHYEIKIQQQKKLISLKTNNLTNFN